MAEEVNSVSLCDNNANGDEINNHKREGNFEESNTKKSKIEALVVKNGAKEEEEEKSSASELGFMIEAYSAEDKGARQSMEDACVVLPDACLDTPGKLRCAHFAVYDGHGGRLAADYAQKHLHENVLSAGLPRGFQSC